VNKERARLSAERGLHDPAEAVVDSGEQPVRDDAENVVFVIREDE
jgi:hypothetical protein